MPNYQAATMINIYLKIIHRMATQTDTL